jgi:diguanylate cyclase (GGDEF)-like protein
MTAIDPVPAGHCSRDSAVQTLYDPLTRLATRPLFADRIDHAVRRSSRRPQHRVAVLIVDLDRFALINESMGHAVGDELLKAVAHRLQGCLRPEDTVARAGDDEFAVLIEDVEDLSGAIRIAERLATALEAPFDFGTWHAHVTASVGITLRTGPQQDAGNLLREAYTAMRRARSDGLGCHRVFDADMHVQALRQLNLENELRQGFDRGEFILYYQPSVSLACGAITGFEALLRWRHPVLGMLGPDDFIAVAERSRLMAPLGRWVVGEACRQIRQWQIESGNHQLTVSVNLSPRELLDPSLIETVSAALAAAELSPSALRLEITERTLIDEHDAIRKVLQDLQQIGVDVALDDFGTGYCSLAYLHSFPIACIKLDRRFVQQLDCEPRDREIAAAIINLGHRLDLEVVAEGVETIQQLRALIALDCTEAQGFLFARPVPADHVPALLTRSYRKLCA